MSGHSLSAADDSGDRRASGDVRTGDGPAQVTVAGSRPLPVLAAISAGGVAGALGRHAVTTGWPVLPDEFPWATFAVNVSGCLLIGVLMVLATRVWADRPLLRPFLGVGVLGGYTTFSAYTVDAARLVDRGEVGTAWAYLGGTLTAALLAVLAGVTLTEWVARRVARAAGRPGLRAAEEAT